MRRVLIRVVALAAVAAVAWSVAAHPLGWATAFGVHPVPDGTPWTYQFWLGFIPSLTVLSLAGAIAGSYHLHNCHSERCWRLGKHKVAGTPWCSRHLPSAEKL